jgi:type IV secretion system protein TrbL
MTICAGPLALTPVCVIAKLPTTVANDAFSIMAGWFGKAADQATSWLWAQIGSATAINLDSPQLRTDLLATGAIAVTLTLTLGLFLVQVITSVLRREPARLGRAAKGLLIALVMSVFAFSVTKILLGVVDQLSEGIVSYTMGTDIAGLGKRLALGSIEGVTNPGLVLIFSLVILAAVAVVWGAMVIRKMLVIIAAVLTPLAFSGATADITAGWVRKWIEFMAAMIASKLLLVIIFMIGVSVMDGAGMATQPGPGQQLTEIATGSLILLMAGFAPWAAIKMFHFTGDALHTAHATAMTAPNGARTVLSAPQKVNLMHSQASHAAAKFSGSGPSTPTSTRSPKDSADLLNANATPAGPGGPANPAATDAGLPATTAAKPVGSAAGSSATGAGFFGRGRRFARSRRSHRGPGSGRRRRSSRHQKRCHRNRRWVASRGFFHHLPTSRSEHTS